ncbi:hypothetical protein GH733_012652 [Mirounga leonina]|nr:hypothetical protein GH733_012652 [Mirounga leonina]
MEVHISKKRTFVANGIFKAELNGFLTRELAEDSYSRDEAQAIPTRTEIIILATKTQNALGEKDQQIREATAVVQKGFGFPEGVESFMLKRQGVLGIKVKIMLPWDPRAKTGPEKPLPDHLSIVEPKDEILPTTPMLEQKGRKPKPPAMLQPVPTV